MRTLGTVVRGIRAPIFRAGDDAVAITAETVLNALKANNIEPHDKDVVAVTESVVARCQGNYATVEQIAADVKRRTGGGTVGLTFPITSRNRFSVPLRGIAMGCKKVIVMMSYPSDEMGNAFLTLDQVEAAGVNPWNDTLTADEFRAKFGDVRHTFTGMDYISFYQEIIESAGAEAEIILSNRVQDILKYTDTVIACDIHSRFRSKRLLREAGAKVVLGLDDILSESVDGSGYNPDYGLLGSNKADETRIKLFPRDSMAVAEALGKVLSEATGKQIEAMIYGDGCFKDPVGMIWEMADPQCCPGFTAGLDGTPNELKLKNIADGEYSELKGAELKAAVEEKIRNKQQGSLVGNMASMGTTPRRIVDLLGSLCDLTSGSGDKGTPIIYIQGYFDNFIDE